MIIFLYTFLLKRTKSEMWETESGESLGQKKLSKSSIWLEIGHRRAGEAWTLVVDTSWTIERWVFKAILQFLCVIMPNEKWWSIFVGLEHFIYFLHCWNHCNYGITGFAELVSVSCAEQTRDLSGFLRKN
jgi:hypothetical protein